jgi:hypothetical protein
MERKRNRPLGLILHEEEEEEEEAEDCISALVIRPWFLFSVPISQLKYVLYCQPVTVILYYYTKGESIFTSKITKLN